jgi:nucleoside-diphosphate-sugar epimerase
MSPMRGATPAAGPVVLVTGAQGAIGSWCVPELLARGCRVIRLDRAERAVTPFPEHDRAALVVADVRDTDQVRDLLARERVSHVLHLAAIVGDPCEADPPTAIEVNGLASARVIEAAGAAGVGRVVAMSTKGVLGPLAARYLHPAYEPVPVDHAPSPRSAYEASKYLVEVAVHAARRERGAGAAAAVRLGTTWGPGKTIASHGAFGFHSDIAAAVLRGESRHIDLDPSQGHDLVFYADIAAGLADLLLAPSPLPEPVYHLGSGRITTIGEFAAALEAASPGVRVTTGDRLAGGRSCLMDIAPARRDAGYAPAWDVPRALARMRGIAAVS